MLILAITIIMSGCAVKPPRFKPDFDKSNAILIEKSVKGLEIVTTIQPVVATTDKVAVVSIERPYTVDLPINYLIEDNLIANLITAGYNVLERDADMIPRLVSEEGEKYKIVDLSRFEGAVKGGGELVIPDQTEIDTQMESADKVLSYRLLECGILYEFPEGGKPVKLGEPRDVTRIARTRLYIRVTDAKTSEIKLATILENEIKDTIPSNQIGTLADIHYTYYEQAMPNLGREKGEQMPVQRK